MQAGRIGDAIVHEFSIASALVTLVRRRASPELGPLKVTIEVGALTGVVPDCLTFYFEGLTRETPLEGSRLECLQVPARVRCGACEAVYEPDVAFALVCTACGALGGEVLGGDELNLLRIEDDDHV